MLITPMLAPLKMCHLFGWTLERYHLTDFAVSFLRCLWFGSGVFDSFPLNILDIWRCCRWDAMAYLSRLLRLLWPLSCATLLCESPESRSVLMQVFLTEWWENFPLVDHGRFFVALKRNWPIFVFPHRSF